MEFYLFTSFFIYKKSKSIEYSLWIPNTEMIIIVIND